MRTSFLVGVAWPAHAERAELGAEPVPVKRARAKIFEQRQVQVIKSSCSDRPVPFSRTQFTKQSFNVGISLPDVGNVSEMNLSAQLLINKFESLSQRPSGAFR